jgi:DNA-binding transcriptional regulator YhcF (GntR family)
MIDISIIKEGYSNMLDNQLINIAVQDGHNLSPEAFNVLKDEFKKRNLEYSFIESIEQRKIGIHREEMQKIKESSDEKYSEALWNYIIEKKENDTSEKEILDGLFERGLDEDSAKKMLSETEDKVTQLVSHYDTQIIIGGLSFCLGVFITLITFSQAKINGGIYVVAWGAIVFGALRFFKAIPQKNKNKVLLNKLSAKK